MLASLLLLSLPPHSSLFYRCSAEAQCGWARGRAGAEPSCPSTLRARPGPRRLQPATGGLAGGAGSCVRVLPVAARLGEALEGALALPLGSNQTGSEGARPRREPESQAWEQRGSAPGHAGKPRAPPLPRTLLPLQRSPRLPPAAAGWTLQPGSSPPSRRRIGSSSSHRAGCIPPLDWLRLQMRLRPFPRVL